MTFAGKVVGIGLFSLEIIHLISLGYKETIGNIETHFDNSDLVEYIYNKYKDDIFVVFDNETYDNSQINKYFNNYSGYIEGQERRKYGIMSKNDGLLLILAVLTDKIEREAHNWKIED